jgi:5-formyltetrahydrofolate cyclo-ligase
MTPPDDALLPDDLDNDAPFNEIVPPSPPDSADPHDKPVWRQWAKQVRNTLSMATLATRIIEQLDHFTPLVTADWVLFYSAKPDELDLSPLLERFGNKRFFCPKVRPAKTLVFHEVTPGPMGPAQLEPGPFGLLEPLDTQAEFRSVLAQATPPQRICLIMPALTADTQGNRLGYGMGYYDRFLEPLLPQLAQAHHQIHLAVALPDALVAEHVPTEPHDICAHSLITELGIIPCRQHP